METLIRHRDVLSNPASVDLPGGGTSSHGNQSTDLREQLFNRRLVGTVGKISTPIEQVCQLYAILLDIDAKQFRVGGPLHVPSQMSPRDLFCTIIQPMIVRHPVLERLEIRCSGGGLHGLLWMDSPVLLRTPNDVERWKCITKVVQAALPIDPKQPSLNALTRPIGSINSKNGRVVERLKEGKSVAKNDVQSLFREMQINAYAFIQRIWFGSERITPCPICNEDGSYLESTAQGYGECYGKCDKVTLGRLVSSVLDSQKNSVKEKKV